MTAHYCSRIPPFGNLRVNGYLLLTAAYRSLSRPSSAPSAKASALCPYSLEFSSFSLDIFGDIVLPSICYWVFVDISRCCDLFYTLLYSVFKVHSLPTIILIMSTVGHFNVFH